MWHTQRYQQSMTFHNQKPNSMSDMLLFWGPLIYYSKNDVSQTTNSSFRRPTNENYHSHIFDWNIGVDISTSPTNRHFLQINFTFSYGACSSPQRQFVMYALTEVTLFLADQPTYLYLQSTLNNTNHFPRMFLLLATYMRIPQRMGTATCPKAS